MSNPQAVLDRVVSEQAAAPHYDVETGSTLDQLVFLVRDLHDATHPGHIRFCDYAACLLADEVLHGQRTP